MATRKSEGSSSDITPGEASYIVDRLLKDRRITTSDLTRYRRQMQEEAEHLLERLRSLGWNDVAAIGAGVAAVAGAVAAPFAARAAGRGAAKVVRRVSAAVTASRQLQGRYMGLSRQIPKPVMKEKFSKEAIKEHGKESVVRLMQEWIAANKGEAAAARKGGRKAPRKAR